MDLKELRSVLKSKDARWSVPDDLGDQLDMEKLSAEYGTGGLPLPPGTLTARQPRIRHVSDGRFLLWQPNVFPLMREAVPRWRAESMRGTVCVMPRIDHRATQHSAHPMRAHERRLEPVV